MDRLLSGCRLALASLLLVLALPAWSQGAPSGTSQAQRQIDQPFNNAPVWRDVRSEQSHYTSTRGVETGVLIQSGGQTWRQLRNNVIMLYGGIALCAVVVVIALYYRLKGPMKLREPTTGRHLERFSPIERAAHWSAAISFCVLGISGLIMLFGKHVLLPLFGYDLFSVVAQVSKNLHNFIGPVFLLAVVALFFLFVRDNVWQAIDGKWIATFGGIFSGEHVPSNRFNFGEKTWFWIGVTGLGLVVSATGLILNFPNFEQGRALMQLSNIIHLVGALMFVCLALGHIYMGTIGVDGAYEAMRYGHVDETWAKEHHELWYEEAERAGAFHVEPDARPATTAGTAPAHG